MRHVRPGRTGLDVCSSSRSGRFTVTKPAPSLPRCFTCACNLQFLFSSLREPHVLYQCHRTCLYQYDASSGGQAGSEVEWELFAWKCPKEMNRGTGLSRQATKPWEAAALHQETAPEKHVANKALLATVGESIAAGKAQSQGAAGRQVQATRLVCIIILVCSHRGKLGTSADALRSYKM